MVRYDRTQLTQIFQNLIHNGVQHLGRPSGSVIVSCREGADGFEFGVRDDGVGIPRTDLERVFRMFQVVDPEGETTGVGLAIVRKIVEMHGGHVCVESTPGHGSTFRFSISKRLGEVSSPQVARGAPGSDARIPRVEIDPAVRDRRPGSP